MAEASSKNSIQSHFKEPYLERSLQYITEEFIQKLRELSLIKRISEALIDAADQKKVCLEIIDIILSEINAEQCSLLLINEETDNLVLKALKSQEEPSGTYWDDASHVVCRCTEGLAGALFQSGEPIYVKNTSKDRRFTKDPLFDETMSSTICLPLISGEIAIGLFKLSAPEPNAFSKEEQNLLQIIANQVANVLRNVQLVNNLQESYREQELVLRKLTEAEKKLSRYSKDLEEIVEKRTNELVQSEKLATVGQLVAGVAHELNNPLAVIMGYVDLLLSAEEIHEKHIPRLEKVHQATMRCARIVSNLLKFSRKGKLERKNIDINEIVKETIELFQYQFKVNTIQLKRHLQKDLPVTAGDPQQLQQVFLNLISNAYDALGQQEDNKKLTIKTAARDEKIVIEFCDTGPGVSPQNQKKLFEPFFTTKEVGKGTGLGLSLSYGIIREHNGEIEYDTSYRKGTKFIVTLPVITEKTSQEQINDARNLLNASTRVLIVDDEEEIISFQQDVLKNYSCSADVASNGKTALEKVGNKNYDVIISDIKMPGKIGGIDFFREIQEINPGMEKRIIFMTGDTASPDTRNFLESIDNFSLEKPFMISEFLDVINRCLKRNTLN